MTSTYTTMSKLDRLFEIIELPPTILVHFRSIYLGFSLANKLSIVQDESKQKFLTAVQSEGVNSQ